MRTLADALAPLGRLTLTQRADVLQKLGVKRIVDTATRGDLFRAAAWWNEDRGTCSGIHITDNPSRVYDKLTRGVDLDQEEHPNKRTQELGPGLYVSAAPAIWKNRSSNKWDFLRSLTPEQQERLKAAIISELQREASTGYISKGELENALRYSREMAFESFVVHVAAPPYVIHSSEPRFLEPLGIRPSTQPLEIEVEFKGEFVELDYGQFVHRSSYGILRRMGFDGAFIPGGFNGVPQTVIWTHRAVVRFGNWTRSAGLGDAGTTLERKVTATPAFKNWFKDSKVVDAYGNPLVVYHGTTHDFDTFDPTQGNAEGWVGRGSYFTDTIEDANANYAGRGPDLRNKIEARYERIVQELEDAEPELSQEEREEMALKLAEEELEGKAGPNVMPVFLKMKNPIVIDDRNPTVIDYDDKSGKKLINAIRKVANENNLDADQIFEDLALFDHGSMTALEVDERLRKSEPILWAEGSEGELIGNEVIRDIWKAAGYDGVIMGPGSAPFLDTMRGTEKGTRHYIVWKPNQIKSAVGNKKFNPRNPNILKGLAALSQLGATRVPLTKLKPDADNLQMAKDDVRRGLLSQTEGPLKVYRRKGKRKLEIADGHHRYVEALNRGDKTIDVDIAPEILEGIGSADDVDDGSDEWWENLQKKIAATKALHRKLAEQEIPRAYAYKPSFGPGQVFISKDASNPGKWRVTRFDLENGELVPVGHATRDSYLKAVEEAAEWADLEKGPLSGFTRCARLRGTALKKCLRQKR